MNSMYEKILLSIDESEDSRRAILKTIDLQKRFNSDVVAVHTIDAKISLPMNVPLVSTTTGLTHSLTTPQEIRRAKRERAERLMNETEDEFRRRSGTVETRIIEDESPDHYIKRAVEHENFDLVVLGCEGHHSKLRRIFSETVPDKIVNIANADVLIVR